MKIIVTGATGLVGAEVIRQAILDNDIEQVTALSRKTPDMTHPKLNILLHQDFMDYSMLSSQFKEYDACAWCLGISQSQVTKEEYHKITYDYTLEAFKAMIKENPAMAFLFVSGAGADSTEKSKTLFARVKGKTENALIEFRHNKLYIVRPAGIKPIHKNPNAPLTNKIMIPLFPILELIIPSFIISSVELAKVILAILKNGSDKGILENSDLKKIYNIL